MRERERWDKRCEWGIAGLVLAALGLGPLFFGAVQTTGLLVILGCTLAAMVLWVVRVWVAKSPRILWTPACWAVLGFVAYAWWRYRFAVVEYPARDEVLKITLYATIFFITLNNLYRQEVTQAVVFSVLTLGMILSFYAVFQFVTNSPYVWGAIKPAMFMHRGSATYICPNHFAGYLEMLLPLGIAATFTSRIKDAQRVLVGYASLSILVGIGVTVSRGAWISTALALAVMFIWFARKPQYRLPAIVAMCVMVMGAAYGLQNAHAIQKRFDQMVTPGTPNDVSSRRLIWNSALELWKSDTTYGVGPGQFDWQFVTRRPTELQWRPANVHNDYLNALVDYGIAGVSIIGLFWILMGVGLVKTWKFVDRNSNDLEVKASNRSAFVMGSTIGLLALLLHSVIDFNFYIPANALQAVVLLALLSSHLRFASDRYWISLKVVGRSVLTVVGVGVVLFVGSLFWQRAVERYWLNRAEEAKETGLRLAAYKRAFKVDAKNSDTAYAIGEIIRQLAWDEGGEGKKVALEAIEWFERGIALNRFDTHNYIRLGMCLHLLDRKEEAERYFKQAMAVDPNNHFVAAYVGWHYYDRRQFEVAKGWFERSLQIKSWANHVSTYYLKAIRDLASAEAGGK